MVVIESGVGIGARGRSIRVVPTPSRMTGSEENERKDRCVEVKCGRAALASDFEFDLSTKKTTNIERTHLQE